MLKTVFKNKIGKTADGENRQMISTRRNEFAETELQWKFPDSAFFFLRVKKWRLQSTISKPFASSAASRSRVIADSRRSVAPFY